VRKIDYQSEEDVFEGTNYEIKTERMTEMILKINYLSQKAIYHQSVGCA
jgi:hypothetical protein